MMEFGFLFRGPVPKVIETNGKTLMGYNGHWVWPGLCPLDSSVKKEKEKEGS